jgi:hypothetical protein
MVQNDNLQASLSVTLNNYVSDIELKKINKRKGWDYGYNDKYGMVVISKTGEISDVIEISGLKIALPAKDNKTYARSTKKSEQYWEAFEYPKELKKIRSMASWDKQPKNFKLKYIDFIEDQFTRREQGFWFKNNGVDTYITGSHYHYLQWSKIDVGLPDYRDANRVFWTFWEACVADYRCYGLCYLKCRRSGFSFMSSSDAVDSATLVNDKRVGILSKTGEDAKKMFTGKVVPININYPFFFKPTQDGMDRPKTELAFRIPAAKITRKNMDSFSEIDDEGLNTSIDWKNTDDNSYDGEKLYRLYHDESGKWLKPNNILNNWRVTKTCLRLGSKVVGKCMMGSTCNAQDKGGENFKKLYYQSDISKRSRNGQTKSGLYKLFIPTEYNLEGHIDRYGMAVLSRPSKPIIGVDNELIHEGAVEYWEAEVDNLKDDSDALNEFYRQFPRTEEHAFRDEAQNCLYNLTKLYEQMDYNDATMKDGLVTVGSFSWENGVKDSRVVFTPDRHGRFRLSWIPPKELQNNVINDMGVKKPGNAHMGAFGCDSYDISGTAHGGASNGALHGKTKFHMDKGPLDQFFLEYVARPQTAEIFFEDVLMACIFYGMPILAENNKPRLLYHFKNRGYRGYSMNRPDKSYSNLSKTERELGGIPSAGEAIIHAHAEGIETYILSNVGVNQNNGEMGNMFFNRTLADWAKFDITKRTKFDASISSGLAIMATQTMNYKAKERTAKKINFARYDNSGNSSRLL